jgi:hypothetical protein
VNPYDTDHDAYSGYDGYGGGTSGEDSTGCSFVREDYETRSALANCSGGFNIVHREEAVGPDAAPYLLRDAAITSARQATQPKTLTYTLNSLRLKEVRVLGHYHSVRHAWTWKVPASKPVSSQSQKFASTKPTSSDDALYASFTHLTLIGEYHYVRHNVPMGHSISLIIPKALPMEAPGLLHDLLIKLGISTNGQFLAHPSLEFLKNHAQPYASPVFSDVPPTTSTDPKEVDKQGIEFKSNLLRHGDGEGVDGSDRNPLMRDSESYISMMNQVYDAVDKINFNTVKEKL